MMKLGFLILVLGLVACGGVSYEDNPVTETDMGPQKSTSGGWSGSVNLVTGINNPQGIQADFPDADYKTLQFGVTPPKSGGGYFQALATIVWSVEGQNIQRQVDVGNGVSISAPGQAFSVTIVDKTTNLGQGLNDPYQVSVNFTPGSRPSTSQPPTLMDDSSTEDSIAASSTRNVPVPQNAGVISVEIASMSVAGPATPLQLELNFLTASGLGNKTVGVTQGITPFIPVPPGCTVLEITNHDTVNDAFLKVTWGIDG